MAFFFLSRAVGATDWAAVDKLEGGVSGRGWSRRRGAGGGFAAALRGGHRRGGGVRSHRRRRRRRSEPVWAAYDGGVGCPRHHDDERARGNLRPYGKSAGYRLHLTSDPVICMHGHGVSGCL